MKPSNRKEWANLFSKGYFPEELPPCFTTLELYDFVINPKFNLQDFDPPGDYQASKHLSLSIPRIKNHRRILSIPGPFNYAQLTQTIAVHRKEVFDLLDASKFSIFKNPAHAESKRYLLKPDFGEFTEQRILRSTGYKYVLSVDINRFYPSVYTHSIPWAIHGKEFAKKNSGAKYFGNLLDKYCRNGQDRQTLGIPISPDSSRIISELILCAVDTEIQQNLVKENFDCVRNVDDYIFYFSSLADLEKGRRKFEAALRKFELEPNINKEKISELPEVIETEWRTAIKAFTFRTSDHLERTDIIGYFDLSISLARKYPADAVLTYAIAKLKGTKVSESNWELLQACLLNSLVLESKTVEIIIRLFLFYKKTYGYDTYPKRVKKAFETFLIYHAEHAHHFEIIWTLWYYLKERLKLPKNVTAVLNNSNNDLVILLLLEMKNKKLIDDLVVEQWEMFVKTENLLKEHWLLSYQEIKKSYYDGEDFDFTNFKFFEAMIEANIDFFQPGLELDEDSYINVEGSSLSREAIKVDEKKDISLPGDDDL